VDALLSSSSSSSSSAQTGVGPVSQQSHDLREPPDHRPPTEQRQYSVAAAEGQERTMVVSFDTLGAAEAAFATSQVMRVAAETDPAAAAAAMAGVEQSCWQAKMQQEQRKGTALEGAWLSDLLQCSVIRASAGAAAATARQP